MTMSKAALARCRRLKIIRQEGVENEIAVLEVTDPRMNDKVVATYRARTEHDITRVKRAYMGQYRIPKELVWEGTLEEVPDPSDEETATQLDTADDTTDDTADETATSEDGGENADGAESGTPDLHEHRS